MVENGISWLESAKEINTFKGHYKDFKRSVKHDSKLNVNGLVAVQHILYLFKLFMSRKNSNST